MADKYAPYPLPPCPDPEPEPTPEPCSEWSICLPFGGRLYSSGGCVYAEVGSPPPDGVYGKIVIANGCIIGAEPEDVPIYTGSPCAPQPDSCSNAATSSTSARIFSTMAASSSGSSGSSGGGCCEPSSLSGNLYKLDAAGKPVVQLSARGGGGLSVTGSGTTSDPLVISLANSSGSSSEGGVYVRSANNAIAASGAGTRADPVVLTHKTGLQTIVNGMSFDAYGHLTSYNASASAGSGVTGIIGGQGIEVSVDQQSKINTISMRTQANDVEGNYAFGAYDVELDEYGRISRLSRGIDLGRPQTLEFDDYKISVNSSGSITRIEAVPQPADPGDGNAVGLKFGRMAIVPLGGPPSQSRTLTATIYVAERMAFHARLVCENACKDGSAPSDVSVTMNDVSLDRCLESRPEFGDNNRGLFAAGFWSRGVLTPGTYEIVAKLKNCYVDDITCSMMYIWPAVFFTGEIS